MQNENRNGELKAESAGREASVSSCPSCHAALLPGTRFCRMCGYRLGEGVEEYAETRRFDGTLPPTTTKSPKSGPAGGPFQMPHMWGAVTPVNPMSPAQAQSSGFWKFCRACSPAQLGWIFWVILSIVVLTAGGIAVKTAKDQGMFGGRAAASMPSAFMGVDGFDLAPGGGGAMIEGIAGPDTPVERAGLIGGDIIVNFDGMSIADDDDMRRVLAATPIGKEVEVVYLRDGQEQRTKLTVGSDEEYRGWDAIDSRPGGKGHFGVDDFERVRVPGQEIYGVRVDDVNRNRPADLAGMKDGDIVIKFGEFPVRTAGDLTFRIYKAEPGSTVIVTVVRGTEQLEIPVKVGRSR